MTYHILMKDIPVIDIITDELNKVIDFKKFVPDGPMQPFWGNNITTERFYDFLHDRCYEDGYLGLKDVLHNAGLSSNNPYLWNRRTHGVSFEDFFWIRYDDENIKWDDVRVQ